MEALNHPGHSSFKGAFTKGNRTIFFFPLEEKVVSLHIQESSSVVTDEASWMFSFSWD